MQDTVDLSLSEEKVNIETTFEKSLQKLSFEQRHFYSRIKLMCNRHNQKTTGHDEVGNVGD